MSKGEKNPDVSDQEWFTPSEAANYLRVGRTTIYRYMDEGLLPYSELPRGRGRRIRRGDLDTMLLEPPAK